MTATLRTVDVINVTKRDISRRHAHGKKGALKKRRQKVTSGYIHAEGAEVDIFPMLNIDNTGRQPFSIDFEINAVHVLMEIDKGAAVSIISLCMKSHSHRYH